MNHIVVIGFMGSGKTRVGKRLAQDLKMPFLDVDKKIAQNMKMSVKELLDKFGEPFYRALETYTGKEMLKVKEPTVISVSAGFPLQEQNQKYLKELGTVIYLKGSVETLKKRLEGKSNPFLSDENREEKIKKMLAQREPVYKKMADIQAVTGEKPFEGLIMEIEEKLENRIKNS